MKLENFNQKQKALEFLRSFWLEPTKNADSVKVLEI